MMTSRERVLAAVDHQVTDRVPRLLYEEAIGYTPTIQRLLEQRCAPQLPRDYFSMDITHVTVAPTVLPRKRFEPWWGSSGLDAAAWEQVDEWGVWWRAGNCYHFAHVESPLRNLRERTQLEAYPWPDLDQPYRYEILSRQVQSLHEQGFAVAAFAGSVFEQSWYLRGMDMLMMDMLQAPEVADFLFERTAALQQYAARQFAKAGVDIIITGDDVAAQRSLLMSLPSWRRFLKPHLAATVRVVREANPRAKVFYHSDGNVEPLIPELIDIGIDILNPLQPECVDPARIKQQYGDRLAFWGAVSVQRTMPLGSPEDVRSEVRKRIRQVGQGGGYILAPAHVLGPETPWENIVAFFEAANEPVGDHL